MIIPHNTILIAVVNAVLTPAGEGPFTRFGEPTGTQWKQMCNKHLLVGTLVQWISIGKHTLANSNTKKFTATSEV